MTDPFSALLSAAEAAAQAGQAQAQQVADLTAKVAELEAELAAVQPKTLWGVNATTKTEYAAAQALDPQVFRYYIPPTAPLAWPTSYQLAAGQTIVLSFKVPPAAILSGSHDAAILALMQSGPTDRDWYLGYWHEPEDEIRNGLFTAADYRAAFAHVAALARQVGPHIRMTLILMNYTLLPASGRTWTDYYPGDAAVDVIAWDAYQQSPTYESPSGPAGLYRAGAQAAASVGKPWAVAETGIGPSFTGAARTQALTAMAKAAQGAVFCCYFNLPPWTITASPSDVAAWRVGQTA